MNMKQIHLLFTVFILAAITSCTKDAEVWQRAKVNEVKLLSYGFYKADNPTALVKDYVAEQISSSTIVILLPENIDRSQLVARYTVSDNDVVRVGEVVQKSGETVNNFNVPIDYIITDDNYNGKYTVTIAKGADYIWSAVPFTIVDSATTMLMKVNPASGALYMMYSQSRVSTADSKAAMARYENNEWIDMGEISDGRVSNFDFTFDASGTPYASYADYTTPTAQFNTVKKFDGTSWTMIGNKGFTPVRVSFNAVAFDDADRLKVINVLDAAGGGFVRREPGVSTFENGSWNTVKIPGRASGVSTYLPVAVLKNGALYLGLYNAVTPNSFSLYKFSNNTWTTLLDAWKDPNATTGNINDFDIDVDDNGNVYIGTSDNSDGGAAKLRVVKYNATTHAVSPVGRYIIGTTGGSANFDLALSPLGHPYFIYKNSSSYPTIVAFDSETQDWGTPHIFESQAVDQLMLSFAPNGEAYAAYVKNRKMLVHKYSAP